MKLKHTQQKSANRSVKKHDIEMALMSKNRRYGWLTPSSKITNVTKKKARHRRREDKHLNNSKS